MLTRFDKLAFASITGLVALMAFVALLFHSRNGKTMVRFLAPGQEASAGKQTTDVNRKVQQAGGHSVNANDGRITILKRWTLPAELTEISAISYIDDQRLACIQDEKGTIYVFNMTTRRIEQRIAFGPPGDYEGMTLVGGVAYVTNSSGVIYEVNHFRSAKPTVRIFPTGLSAANDVEGLGWDQNRERLLLTVKKDRNNRTNGIYAFDLKQSKRSQEPVIEWDMNHPLFMPDGRKKPKDFQPSSISVHRTTGDIYVLEGAHQRLLILDLNGNPKRLVQLPEADFAQPEGITFSPRGDMFISNEGKTGSGNILQIILD